MRGKIGIAVFAFAGLACYFGGCVQTEVEEPPPVEVVPVTDTPAPQPFASPQEPEVSPTPPVVGPDTGENRIQFPPGGTWVELGTHLDEDSTIEYVLSAMEGQIMSVSIEQSWPFIVEVADKSGLLSDSNFERPFWRGALPATQDYFITVKAHAAGDFTLRVAINPPGEPYQFFDYVGPGRSFRLRYSDEFAPTTERPVGDYKGEPALVLVFNNPTFYSPATNLGEAYFIISVIEDAQLVNTCTQPLSPREEINGQLAIGGYSFTRSEIVGAAAGNLYELVINRTVYDGKCYEAVFYMHSGNIGNYSPGTVEEFDRAALLGKFEAVLSTFTVE